MSKINLEIYADGANLIDIEEMAQDSRISGFTTNPTLMAQSGITDYLSFAKSAISVIGNKPLSLEVFSDDVDEMYDQAHILNELGDNVWVKIPISNTKQEYTYDLISRLVSDEVKLNVTAVFTEEHIKRTYQSFLPNSSAIVSIFAGRIANTGLDPEDTINYASKIGSKYPNTKILWASSREVFNIIQAQRSGANIITLPSQR